MHNYHVNIIDGNKLKGTEFDALQLHNDRTKFNENSTTISPEIELKWQKY